MSAEGLKAACGICIEMKSVKDLFKRNKCKVKKKGFLDSISAEGLKAACEICIDIKSEKY